MAVTVAAAAKLLIKPVIKQLKKTAIKRMAETGVAKGAGLSVSEISKLTDLDILNLVRAKAVKGAKKEVAESLGISVKELNETVKDLRMTDVRKRAVKGRNYVMNANRFLQNPVKSIASQGKGKILHEYGRLAGEMMDDDFITKFNEGEAQRIELDLLQGSLRAIHKNLKLPRRLWRKAHKLNVEYLRHLRYNVELDMNATVSATGDMSSFDFVIVTEANGGKGGGYKEGILFPEYISHLVDLVLKGTTETKVQEGMY